jgi:hypothetical protein
MLLSQSVICTVLDCLLVTLRPLISVVVKYAKEKRKEKKRKEKKREKALALVSPLLH